MRIELFVEDIERSAAFYCDVLGFARARESAGYRAVRRGQATIGIGLARNLPDAHPIKGNSGERRGIGVEIAVEVEDVDAAYEGATSAGWRVHGPVQQRPWGLRDFRLSDLDGYYVRVTSR